MIEFDIANLYLCSVTGILGCMSGIVGSWLFLQKKSLFGDTIAHATFPGLTGIFLITFIKKPEILLLGGIISAIFAAYCINLLQQNTTLKKDTILGIILVSSFGLGTIMLSKIQSLPQATHAGLTKYLLGNPATMLYEDFFLIGIISLLTLVITQKYFQTYMIVIFDPTYATTIGIDQAKIAWIMLIPITLTIVSGLQTVGIILMSALLINPAAAAYQWTKNFYTFIGLAAAIGGFSTILGTILSCSYDHLPTGPVIVIICTLITIISIFISPQGIITSWLQHKNTERNITTIQYLSRFLLFNEGIANPYHPHNLAALTAIDKNIPPKELLSLEKLGFIESPSENYWRLTPLGVNFLKTHLMGH